MVGNPIYFYPVVWIPLPFTKGLVFTANIDIVFCALWFHPLLCVELHADCLIQGVELDYLSGVLAYQMIKSGL